MVSLLVPWRFMNARGRRLGVGLLMWPVCFIIEIGREESTFRKLPRKVPLLRRLTVVVREGLLLRLVVVVLRLLGVLVVVSSVVAAVEEEEEAVEAVDVKHFPLVKL